MLPTPMMQPASRPTTYNAVYDPDGVLIALFMGPHSFHNANIFWREECSEFCMVREYANLRDVLRVI